MDQNDADLQGDGDQSRVQRKDQQFYREMFATGGDINHLANLGLGPLSDFAKYCISGQVELVKQTLERVAHGNKDPDFTAEPVPELIKLLETRETALRLSPLMMIVSIGKNLESANGNRQVQVAKLLLQYGARPDARDVCGKTVCHYGMGAMATKMTLNVVHLCMEAHPTSHLFGKKVQLHSLKTASKNGQQGWCKGYVTDTGRRAVYLIEEKHTVGIKPANIRLVEEEDGETTPTPTKLCDIPDRLGVVCLLEVIQADRVDVARVLLREYHANLDIEDCDGISPRKLSTNTALMSSVATMVNKAAAKESKKEQKESLLLCSNCGKLETKDTVFQVCSICNTVQYCGKKCQRQHWNKGGHKNVCAGLAEQQSVAIVLEKPKGDQFYSVVSYSSLKKKNRGSSFKQQKESAGYTKPSNVNVDEKFVVKVQGSGSMAPLMVYDKSREFNITVSPESPGFGELLKAIKAEPTWQGRKTFVAASFDADGNCTVYPGLTSIHKW